MIQSLKIKDGLYFNMFPIQAIKTKDLKIEDETTHQFLIFDRSGSMYGYLDPIIQSAIEYCNQLAEGTTISVGYFSGMNEYSLSVPFLLRKELYGLSTVLNSWKKSLGMTNFIQILSKVNEIASKLSVKSHMFFFTDGCHNTGGTYQDIEKVLKDWINYAATTTFVGYGYIDREMLSKMASITNGSFIHLDKFSSFSNVLNDFGTTVEDSKPFINVNVDFTNEKILPVSISGKSVVEYSVTDSKLNYRPSKKDFQGLYFLTNNEVKNSSDIVNIDITAERGIRALAMIHSQKNNANIALDLLSLIGDKYLIQALYSAITPEEFADAENKIRKSVFIPNERFLEGTVKNFLPADDAFCVLDAIGILNEDESVKVYIHDKEFEYERIGKSSKQTDGPKIEFSDNVQSSLGSIVMNKERLNLNISTVTKGKVPLIPAYFKNNPFLINDLDELELNGEYEVDVFRTYNIICDGKLQTKKLVVSDLGKETINRLGQIITRRKDKKYVVDFSNLPVINRTYTKHTSAEKLANHIWQEKILMDRISLLNHVKKEEEQKIGYTKVAKELTEEQAKFLLEHCYIKGNYYSPPLEAVDTHDEYEAYLFSIDIKGFSKVSASDIIKKIQNGKECTQRELIMKESYELLQQDLSKLGNGKELITSLETRIKDLNNHLSVIRTFIQGSKFAIVLANKGKMDEFKSRENMELELNQVSLKGAILKVKFIFKIEKTTIKI